MCLGWSGYFSDVSTVGTAFTGMSHWYVCSQELGWSHASLAQDTVNGESEITVLRSKTVSPVTMNQLTLVERHTRIHIPIAVLDLCTQFSYSIGVVSSHVANDNY